MNLSERDGSNGYHCYQMDTFVGTDLDVPLPVLSSSVPVHSFVDPAGLILPQAQSLEIPAQQAAYAWDPPPVPWSREVFTPSGLGGCATVAACCSDCLLLYTYADAHCRIPLIRAHTTAGPGSSPPALCIPQHRWLLRTGSGASAQRAYGPITGTSDTTSQYSI